MTNPSTFSAEWWTEVLGCDTESLGDNFDVFVNFPVDGCEGGETFQRWMRVRVVGDLMAGVEHALVDVREIGGWVEESGANGEEGYFDAGCCDGGDDALSILRLTVVDCESERVGSCAGKDQRCSGELTGYEEVAWNCLDDLDFRHYRAGGGEESFECETNGFGAVDVEV